MKVEFAVPVSTRFVPYEKLKQFWLAAEKLGYDHIWYQDHLLGRFSISDATNRIYECWTILSAMAATTSTIRIGSEMICNNFRSPSLLAKMTSTLDVVSNGRLELGLGIGWDPEEHHAYGMQFGSHEERCARLEETVQVIRKLWTEEKPSFDGRFYKLNEAYCSPKPLQKPHPPIMIGGSSERILQLVAHYGNSCHMFQSPDKYSRKIRALEEYCKMLGRDSSTITKTVGTAITDLATPGSDLRGKVRSSKEQTGSKTRRDENVESCVRKIRNWNKLGVARLSIDFPDMPQTGTLAWFADQVMTQFKR